MSADEIREGHYATNLDLERIRQGNSELAAIVNVQQPQQQEQDIKKNKSMEHQMDKAKDEAAYTKRKESSETGGEGDEDLSESNSSSESQSASGSVSASASAYPKSNVYTRSGDKGSTSLYTGERRNKNDPIFEALGTIDELNAHIGLAREHCIIDGNQLEVVLEVIQSRLFDVGTHIATPLTTASATQVKRASFPSSTLKELELKIDELDAQLPVLRNFILPGGGLAAAELHVCRTVCRRAERLIIPLYASGPLEATVLKFINRLSDFLFVAARWVAMTAGNKEVIYQKGRGLSPNPKLSENS